jgi:hypothetical protein
MIKDFIDYTFGGTINDYTISYDSSKLNMGYLMTRSQDANGDEYVSPIESKFLRIYELGGGSGFFQINTAGFLKYNNDISWIFYSNGNPLGTTINVMRLATYSKSNNLLTEIGSVSITSQAIHSANCINPSLEKHITGTVSVTASSVTGAGTTWLTDGVCAGNRIGFGSTNSDLITQWYSISSVISNTSLVIRREYATDGVVETLNIPAGTPYVIEDLRLIYVVRNTSTSVNDHGIGLVKGLRFENFRPSQPTIPISTTVDNIRAYYRILDSAGATASFVPSGLILENKVSLTEQYLYVQSNPAVTSISIQRFNIRAALTVTAGRSNSAYNFTTGTVNHLGTNISLFNPFIKGTGGDYYVNLYTRISRIIPANITSGSTNFIGDAMIEVPLGNVGTFPLSSQLQGFHYLPNANKFYISHLQGTIRNYVTSYSAVGGQFERVVHINNTVQSNTYTVTEVDTLTANFDSSILRTFYHDGLSYIFRDFGSNKNVMYTLPIEADKMYHTTTKACIITPEFTATAVVTYDRVYLNKKGTYNNERFVYPSENVDIYVRTSGISDDSGAWTLVAQNGDISYLSSSSIQFKIAFSTIGINCVPDKIYGIAISYFSNDIPKSLSFYEPSLTESSISSQIFAWRQISEFISNIPNLSVDIYNASTSALLLNDDTNTPINGTWEYSSNNGISWNTFSPTANAIGNYIRYTPSSSLGTGIKVKPILYTTSTSTYISPSAPIVPTLMDLDAELFLGVANISNTTIRSAINQLVIDLKNANIWIKITLLYPFVGGTAITHRLNLKNPNTYALTFTGGWVHNSLGILMNNIDTFASTGYSANNGNLAMSAYLTQRTNGAQGAIMGAYNSGIFALRATATQDIFHNESGTTGKTITPAVVHPFLGNSRTAANSWFAQNGNNVFTNYTDAAPSVSSEVRIGNISNTTWYGAHQLGFAHVSDPLTQAEMTLLRTAVINFETALGRA